VSSTHRKVDVNKKEKSRTSSRRIPNYCREKMGGGTGHRDRKWEKKTRFTPPPGEGEKCTLVVRHGGKRR